MAPNIPDNDLDLLLSYCNPSPPPPPKAETLEASARNTTLSESSNATDAREALISSLDVQREVNLAIQRVQDLIQQDQVAFSDLTY